MIFGFNTDVVCGATCYHLQSEFRTRERLLQTQVFVTGRCLGKVAHQAAAGRDDIQCQQDLREQHRAAVTAAREGAIEQWLGGASEANTASPLELELLDEPMPWRDGALRLSFRVRASGEPREGVSISVRSEQWPEIAQSETGEDGTAQITFEIGEAVLGGCVLIATARAGEAEATHRFRLRSYSALS